MKSSQTSSDDLLPLAGVAPQVQGGYAIQHLQHSASAAQDPGRTAGDSLPLSPPPHTPPPRQHSGTTIHHPPVERELDPRCVRFMHNANTLYKQICNAPPSEDQQALKDQLELCINENIETATQIEPKSTKSLKSTSTSTPTHQKH